MMISLTKKGENMSTSDQDLTENTTIINKSDSEVTKSDIQELRDSLIRAETQGEDNVKAKNIPQNDSNSVAWVCSDFILDLVEDKPYRFADYLHLSSRGADAKEREEILTRLPITDNDKKLSRAWAKKIIESLVAQNPELGKFFSEENLFFIRVLSREYEVYGMLNLIRERNKAQNKEEKNV